MIFHLQIFVLSLNASEQYSIFEIMSTKSRDAALAPGEGFKSFVCSMCVTPWRIYDCNRIEVVWEISNHSKLLNPLLF